MFNWFKKKTDLEIFVSSLHKKENYDVDLAAMVTAVDLVSKYPIQPEMSIDIRDKEFRMYRSHQELVDCLSKCYGWLSDDKILKDNLNHGVVLKDRMVDTWLVTADDYRVDYYVFIEEWWLPNMRAYLALLAACKEESTKVTFSSLEYNLYTLHHDLLSLAEIHLSFVYANPSH